MKAKKQQRYDAIEDMSDGEEDFTYLTERAERIGELIDFIQRERWVVRSGETAIARTCSLFNTSLYRKYFE